MAINMLVSSKMASTTGKVLSPMLVEKNMLVSSKTASTTDKVLYMPQTAQS